MRWSLRVLAVGLLAACLAGTASAGGKKPAGKVTETPACGEYGTSVTFEKTPSDAAAKARKEEKLVMVLHVSGHFEDSEFT